MMLRRAILLSLCGAAALLLAADDDAASPAQFTATLANVVGAPDAVRIEILRWSTEQEGEALLSAWSLKAAPAAAGRGAGKAAAKGGRGAPKDAPAAAPQVLVPETQLAKALQEAATVGYLWTSELSGYALRYAGRTSAADGSQRIVLITQRRLGAMNQRWVPVSGAPNSHELSVIELRLNAKGQGEGKVSLTGNLAAAAKIVTLENYESAPVVFRDVRPATKQP